MCFYTLVVLAHVAAGSIALVIAPIVMVTRKGGANHRRWGIRYVLALIVLCWTSFLLFIRNPIIFNLEIAVLSLYPAWSGYRVLHRKNRLQHPARVFDWIAAIVTLFIGLATSIWGIIWLRKTAVVGEYFPAVAAGLALFIVSAALQDILAFTRPTPDPYAWWYHHMRSMVASYIAITSGFLVQAVTPRLIQAGMSSSWQWVSWIVASAIGLPGLAVWVAYYRRRFRHTKLLQ